MQTTLSITTFALTVATILLVRHSIRLRHKINEERERHKKRKSSHASLKLAFTQCEGLLAMKDRQLESKKKDIQNLKDLISIQERLLEKRANEIEVHDPIREPGKAL